MINTTNELCPHCNNEVEIINDKPSKCPVCGETILPCSMCDMDKVKCNDCKFSKPQTSKL